LPIFLHIFLNTIVELSEIFNSRKLLKMHKILSAATTGKMAQNDRHPLDIIDSIVHLRNDTENSFASNRGYLTTVGCA